MKLCITLLYFVWTLIWHIEGVVPFKQLAHRAQFLSSMWVTKPDVTPPKLEPEFATQIRDHLRICKSAGFGSLDGKTTYYSRCADSNDDVLLFTKMWTQKMIADFQICPFTIDAEKAGIPRGSVRYTVSHATTPEEAFADYWDEVDAMMSTTNFDIATVLLVLPNMFADIADFEKFTNCLDDSLETTGFGEALQLVYFHKNFQFKDKDGQNVIVVDENTGDVLGFSKDIIHPIDFSRRSPWPMINILRDAEVSRVQRGVPKGRVYEENINRLDCVGVATLQNMLDKRDWSGLSVDAFSSNGSRDSSLRRTAMDRGSIPSS